MLSVVQIFYSVAAGAYLSIISRLYCTAKPSSSDSGPYTVSGVLLCFSESKVLHRSCCHTESAIDVTFRV